MDEETSNHRFHYNLSVFQRAVQGRWPSSKDRQEEGWNKIHASINANECVPCDVRFTSAATNDSFMIAPSSYPNYSLVAMDRAYINYKKFEVLTERNVVYVTKLKKNLTYEVLEDCMDMTEDGKMKYREQVVVFRKGKSTILQE